RVGDFEPKTEARGPWLAALCRLDQRSKIVRESEMILGGNVWLRGEAGPGHIDKAAIAGCISVPSLSPRRYLRGVFGDPHARVVKLVRRSKKRRAGCADGDMPAGTTARFGAPAILRPAICGYSWSSRCGASSAVRAAR